MSTKLRTREFEKKTKYIYIYKYIYPSIRYIHVFYECLFIHSNISNRIIHTFNLITSDVF